MINILNVLDDIIHAKQNGVFKAKPEFVLVVDNHPPMTVGICDFCKNMDFENNHWMEPYCKKKANTLIIDIPNGPNAIKNCVYFQSTSPKFLTKGDIDVRTLEIGDVIYEHAYGVCIKSTVVTKPELDQESRCMNWTTKRKDGTIMNYSHNIDYPHYSVNIYRENVYMNVTLLE